MSDIRKIIHIDMDAFFASVEQRDCPELKGKPVIVGRDPNRRGVVATCSYEARVFGIHSAMPSKVAYRLCPNAVFIKPRIDVYKAVSMEILEILHKYTNIVEPLSLDEAFLDVTENKLGVQYATSIAKEIKKEIFEKTKLTASAGVSFNKMLAKIASDFRKPNGITVITPEMAPAFIDRLPIGKFFGIGKVTEEKLKQQGIMNGADLKLLSKSELLNMFNKRGEILFNFINCNDDRPVNPNRVRKSMGREITFEDDIDNRDRLNDMIWDIACMVEKQMGKYGIKGSAVTLKVKFSDFQIITRRQTVDEKINDAKSINEYAKRLLQSIDFENRKVRLIGINLSNFDRNDMTDAEDPPYKQLSLNMGEDYL